MPDAFGLPTAAEQLAQVIAIQRGETPKTAQPAAPAAPTVPSALNRLYIYTDPKRDKYFLAGWVMGNLTIYRAFAKDVKGDVKKLTEALKLKLFEGDLNADGSLVYAGQTWRWQDLDAIPGSG